MTNRFELRGYAIIDAQDNVVLADITTPTNLLGEQRRLSPIDKGKDAQLDRTETLIRQANAYPGLVEALKEAWGYIYATNNVGAVPDHVRGPVRAALEQAGVTPA